MPLWVHVEGIKGSLVAHPDGAAAEGQPPRYIGLRFVARPADQQGTRDTRKAVEAFCKGLPKKRNPSPIDHALTDAVITAPDKHDAELLSKLDAVAGRLLRQHCTRRKTLRHPSTSLD